MTIPKIELLEENNGSKILQLLCQSKKKWGIFYNGPDVFFPEEPGDFQGLPLKVEDRIKEFKKAAPWTLKQSKDFQTEMMCGSGYLFFETEKEMWDSYNSTASDDGPTTTNTYSGPWHIYMLTCSPDGELGNENT